MPEQLIERVRRLDFSLPPFRRLTWVSDQARSVWEPRIRAIVSARPRVFALAARAGLYPCASLRLPESEIGEFETWLRGEDGLALARLDAAESGGGERDDVSRTHVVVGRREAVEAFAAGWRNDERAVTDELRRLPPCCRAFRDKVRDDWKLVDPVLAQALNTPGAVVEDGVVSLESPKLLNTLPASLDILPLGHTPCSFGCRDSLTTATVWVETARAHGFGEEMDNLQALLSWPAEWSALHGIAEIRTPILKLAANTDATADVYRVRLLSDAYPDEGVSGLRFPFRQPHSAKVTASKSFKEGLSNPIRALNVLGQERPQPIVAEAPRQTRSADEGILRLRPRGSRILDETLSRLRERVPVDRLMIESIYLSNYFNVIRLSDNSVGACMNYFRFKSEEAAVRTRSGLLERAQGDPLLLDYLGEEGGTDLLRLSLKACVVNALSQNLLMRADTFRVTTDFDPRFFPPAESAVVIGFGGYMDYLIHMTDIRRIHVSDLWIQHRAASIRRRLELYRERFPERTITFSDGSDNRERLARADLVCVTGSAFCSGTMDELLEDARDCRTVIVQGQSAAVIPDVLFERGVTLLSTSIKPANLVELAASDPPQFKTLLEGKLPKVYLEPLA